MTGLTDLSLAMGDLLAVCREYGIEHEDPAVRFALLATRLMQELPPPKRKAGRPAADPDLFVHLEIELGLQRLAGRSVAAGLRELSRARPWCDAGGDLDRRRREFYQRNPHMEIVRTTIGRMDRPLLEAIRRKYHEN